MTARTILPTTEQARSLELAGRTVPYLLRRSARARRLRVAIDPERGVVVTIPARRGWSPSVADVEGFLSDRERWLRRHLDGYARRHADLAAPGPLADGSVLPFRGADHLVRVLEVGAGATRSCVTRTGDDMADALVVELASSDRRSLAAVLEAWLRDRARAAISREIEHHAPALGVEPTDVTIRDQRSRWGSASRERRLSFSWRLVLAPPQALETVVVHELAHLRVFGHGPQFWAIVASRVPDHVRWRRWLNDHSFELRWALRDAL